MCETGLLEDRVAVQFQAAILKIRWESLGTAYLSLLIKNDQELGRMYCTSIKRRKNWQAGWSLVKSIYLVVGSTSLHWYPYCFLICISLWHYGGWRKLRITLDWNEKDVAQDGPPLLRLCYQKLDNASWPNCTREHVSVTPWHPYHFK